MGNFVDNVQQLRRFITSREFATDIRRTYFGLRITVAVIGFSLPIVLVLWGRHGGIPAEHMGSLSAFYWLPDPGVHGLMRDWFVASLSAIGVCLIVYEGYGRLENWLLNAAGVSVIGVALNPMPWPNLHAPRYPIHYGAAIAFFALIAITIWCCARNTLTDDVDARTRGRWLWAYAILGWAMAVVPGLAWLLGGYRYGIIGAEVGGAWVFAAYWLAKTYEVAHISQVEPPHGAPPKLKWSGGKLMKLT